ncbi:tetratricopeptide repeat protein, partial [Candidatus Sumerlaeota bacterium]|nr:tetratricopeptide repeat protein [Candidatus Sumerlaeota bacterium]
YGTLIFYTAEHVAATWAAFWAAALILVFIKTEKEKRAPYFFILGLLGGLSILTRPTFLPFFIIGCILLFVKIPHPAYKTKGVIFQIILLSSGFFLTILPVCFLNRHVTGKFTFLPYSGGINFYIGNNEDYCRTVTIRPGYEWDKLTALPAHSGAIGPWEGQDFFYEKSREFIKTNPGAFLALLGRKTLRFFSSREIPRNIDIYLYRRWSSLLKALVWKIGGFGFPFGLLFPLALIGLYNQRRRIPMILILFLLFFSLSVILIFPSSRYRVPLLPLMIILCAAGSVSLWRLISQKKWRDLTPAAFIFLAALLITFIPGPFCEERINYEGEMYYALGHQANEKGDKEETIRLYAKALEIAPELDDARNNLGAALVEMEAPEEGVNLFLEVLKKNPEREDAHNNLAMALARLHEFNDAISHYKRAIEINPHFTEAYYNLANCQRTIGQNEAAIQNYKTALQTKPDYVKASFNLANLYAGIGELNSAVLEYQSIILKEPANIDARNNLANVYLLQKRYEEADKEFRKTLAIRPNFPPSLFGLGNVFFEKKDYDSALARYREAIDVNPQFAQAFFKMGNIFQMRGESGEAISHYEKAMNLIPEWDKPAFHLAWIYASCDRNEYRNPQEAIRIAERLCGKTSYSNAGFLDLLAAAYAGNGRFKEAVETAQKALTLWKEGKGGSLSEEIRKRLKLYQDETPFQDSCAILTPYPEE